MGRACTVCTHPEANSIDAALGAGQTLRALAAQYGLSDSALDRHARRHLWSNTETATNIEPAQGTKNITMGFVGGPKKKQSVPAWLWAFAAGYTAHWFLQHARINGPD